MGNIQYKTGGLWADVPAAALAGSYAGGGPVVERPEKTDRDGAGALCGAVGRPRIVLRTAKMTGTGWAHWMARYVAGGTDYQTAWDPEASAGAGAWSGWSGTLVRPKGNMHMGSDAAHTSVTDVEIVLDNVTAATWP